MKSLNFTTCFTYIAARQFRFFVFYVRLHLLVNTWSCNWTVKYSSNKVIFIGLDDQKNFYAVEYSRFLYLLALVIVFLKPYFCRVLDGTTKPFLQVFPKVRSQKSYWHREHQSSILGSGSIPFFSDKLFQSVSNTKLKEFLTVLNAWGVMITFLWTAIFCVLCVGGLEGGKGLAGWCKATNLYYRLSLHIRQIDFFAPFKI